MKALLGNLLINNFYKRLSPSEQLSSTSILMGQDCLGHLALANNEPKSNLSRLYVLPFLKVPGVYIYL